MSCRDSSKKETEQGISIRSSTIGRADLLELRQYCAEDNASLARWLGYVHGGSYSQSAQSTSAETTSIPVRSKTEGNEWLTDQPGPEDPEFWYLHRLETRSFVSTTGDGVTVDVSSEVAPREILAEPQVQHLHSVIAIQQTLSQRLARSFEGRELDVPRTVRQFARNQPLNRLPRRHRVGQCRELVVLVDTRPSLLPLFDDYRQWVAVMGSRYGWDLMRCVALPEGPRGKWLDAMTRTPLDSDSLPSGSQLVLLSDRDHPNQTPHPETPYRSARRYVRHNLLHIELVTETANPEVVDYLVAAAARCFYPPPELIRDLRIALSPLGLHSSAKDELAVWNHPDRDHRRLRDWRLHPSRQGYWLERFSALKHPIQQVMEAVLQRWRRRLPDESAWLEQLLGWSIGVEEKPIEHRVKNALRLLDSIGQERRVAERWLFHAIAPSRLVGRQCGNDPALRQFYRIAQRYAAQHSLPQPAGHYALPDQLYKEQLAFIQQGESLSVIAGPSARNALWQGSGPWLSEHTGVLLRAGASIDGVDDAVVSTPEQLLTFKHMVRPRWARSLWRDHRGLQSEHVSGAILLLREASKEEHESEWTVLDNKLSWASNLGVDSSGLWSEFLIGSVRQRLRWIPPGEFQMGSPEDEPDRYDGETLHSVTLTEGYWLADTACTQALWEAVMGENPSRSQGEDRPVERVSWDEVQAFIQRLNEQVPDLPIRLPTEAEWEYAARAGTETPFWWGSTLSTEQANYDGNIPYHKGETGEYREETVPVKSFKANPWGLYQVHGNVYEWCADWYREYPSGPVVDPQGPESGEERVIRGGSWSNYGGWLRAAYRIHFVPDNRNFDVGFRLAAGLSDAERRARTN